MIDRKTEAKVLRLLEATGGPSKRYLDLWKRMRARTIAFVLDQPEVRQRVRGTHHAVVGASLRLVRPGPRGQLPRRIAEVGIYDYDRNVLVVHVVDLRRGRLVETEEHRGIQPPITDAELEEARRLVVAHDRYRNLGRTGKLAINAFQARVSFLPDHPAHGHRVFTLVFWSAGKNPKRLGSAVVDLSDRRVLEEDADDDRVIETMARHAASEGAREER